MRKDIRNMAFGFTMAELLISLLITSVLAAAMVPVIGLKKVKAPRNRFHHGIAECYYDAEGQLTYYYADNNRNRAGTTKTVEGSSCVFTAPKADYFEIIAIGAGGEGSGDPSSLDFNISNNVVSNNGWISIGGDFQKTINEAKVPTKTDIHGNPIEYLYLGPKIRTLLNQWALSARKNELYAEYYINSPLGNGGIGQCKAMRYNNASAAQTCKNKCSGSESTGDHGEELKDQAKVGCGEPYSKPGGGYWYTSDLPYLKSTMPNDKCWYFLHGKGEDSGKGLKTMEGRPLHVLINGGTAVTVLKNINESGVSLDIPNITQNEGPGQIKWVKMTKSADGNGAYYQNGVFISNSLTPPANATCEASSNLGSWCSNSTQVINDYYVAGAAGGWEYPQQYHCGATFPSPKAGEVHYYGDGSKEGEKSGALEWKYKSMGAKVSFPKGGTPGTVRTLVYEKLKGNLYLTPAGTQAGLNNTQQAQNKTIVSRNADGTDVVVTASSGNNSSIVDEQFALNVSELPIPNIMKELSIIDNKNIFATYLSKISSSGFNGGLAGCEDTNTCPGFAGSGVYMFISKLPTQYTLSIKNHQGNNIPEYSLVDDNTSGTNVDYSDKKCLDDADPVNTNINVHYFGPGGVQTLNPKYCIPSNTSGSPGAVIIVW